MIQRLGERNERVAWRTGGVQGPQGISSSKTISSVNIIAESLQSLKETIKNVNPGYLNTLGLASLLTLVVEHHFSKIRSRNPTSTVLEYAHLFGPTMKVDGMWISLFYCSWIFLWTPWRRLPKFKWRPQDSTTSRQIDVSSRSEGPLSLVR